MANGQSTFLARMANGSTYLGPQPYRYGVPAVNRGPLGFIVNKGERYVTALGLGLAKGAYREKMLWWGLPSEMLGGLAFTAAAAVLKIVAGARGYESALAPHAEAIGDTGMTTWLNGVGAVWGHKWKGRHLVSLPPGADTKALPPGSTVIAGLPQAKSGKFLSDEEIARWTSPR